MTSKWLISDWLLTYENGYPRSLPSRIDLCLNKDEWIKQQTALIKAMREYDRKRTNNIPIIKESRTKG